MNHKLKLSLLSVCSAIICLALVEAVLSLHSRAKLGPDHRRRRITERRSFLSGERVGFDDPRRVWENSLRLHPLFGYTFNPRISGVNNYGFICPHDFGLREGGYYLEDAPTNSLVVGFFGGSFAEITALQTSGYVENRLRALYPNRDPVVVNLAIGGHALPQSAFIFLYFSSMIDIAIFADGVNEPWNYLNNNLAGYPPEFAKATHYEYKISLNALTPERLALTRRIVRARGDLGRITSLSLLPVIRASMISQYAWVLMAARLDQRIATDMQTVKKSYMTNNQTFYEFTQDDLIRLAASRWAQFHDLIHWICIKEGILDIHVLQPSPYGHEAKRAMTAEEDEIMKRDETNTRVAVTKAFPVMRDLLSNLHAQGLHTLDLSRVFSNETAQVWTDPWHVNEAGGMKVADAICDLIAAAGGTAGKATTSKDYAPKSLTRLTRQ